ncbi:hypothetical protein GCM10025868_37800 [Angustibacter aerolatus]|uniref:MalT-like TPR region domain-containing protein n=1 Tax=Angustibacter aerolatus TaxID=1162965 RepID=A0ABQ6JJW2_9ACTN|nr:hypothetical protein [Angustibacter aerolatus]GMA88530.1 hypothetical protein GCM10025868_37800 [Angustibacter aerolatus]
MDLTATAGRILTLAQDGGVHEAARLAHEALDDLSPDRGPSAEEAGLWYAVSVLEMVRDDLGAMQRAADRCLHIALDAGSPGWASNGYALHALSLVRQQQVEPALVDLARAEAEPGPHRRPRPDGLGLHLARRGLRRACGCTSLAVPHYERALTIPEDALPLPGSDVIDWLNLAQPAPALGRRAWSGWCQSLAGPDDVLAHRARAAEPGRHRRPAHAGEPAGHLHRQRARGQPRRAGHRSADRGRRRACATCSTAATRGPTPATR